MDDKIVKVKFEEGWDTQFDESLTRGDYGQTLQIEGLSLPDGNVEVHFSLTEYDGEAPVSIGTVKDNVITVAIPDFILQKENVTQSSYCAWAWIYVTDGESGQTIRKIEFTIDSRPKATTNVPEDQKDPFLQEVRQVMAETKEIAQSVREDANNGKFSGIPGEKGDDGKSAYEYAKEGGFEGTEQEFLESLAKCGDYITKEEHEAELLKAMVKVTTDKAPFHHITDSANMKVVDFGMEGKTEQETTPGNQLFDISKFPSSTNRINNGDGTITLNSYSVDIKGRLSECCPNIKVGQVIKISGTNVNQMYIGNAVFNVADKSITITQEMLDQNWFDFYGNTETTSDNPLTISDIMINEGTTALPYEPYTNGPSPNPDYPQEIELAGVYNEETGRYEHKCYFHAKNLVDENGWQIGYVNSDTAGGKLNHTNNAIGRYQHILVPKNAKIQIRFYSKDDTSLLRAKYHLVDEDNVVTSCFYDSSKGTWTSFNNIDSGNACKLIISILDVRPEDADIWVNLVELSDFDGYYTSQPLTLTSDRPLTKWDSLVKRDGVWYWDYAGKEYEVTGKERWFVPEDTQNYLTGASSNMFWTCDKKVRDTYNIKNGFVDRLSFVDQIWSKDDGTEGFDFNYQQIHLRIKNSVLGVSDDATNDEKKTAFVAYLQAQYNAGTPVKVYYELAEHELVPLPDEEQELLHNLEMYYGVTNVYNEQGCPMWLTYAADQELHWNQKLLQIQQAII